MDRNFLEDYDSTAKLIEIFLRPLDDGGLSSPLNGSSNDDVLISTSILYESITIWVSLDALHFAPKCALTSIPILRSNFYSSFRTSQSKILKPNFPFAN